MAYDLIFKTVRMNWARDASDVPRPPRSAATPSTRPDAAVKRTVTSAPKLPKKAGVDTSSGELVGRREISGREELLGEFVGDEERLARESGPAERAASARISGTSPRRNRGGKGARRLRKLVWRASRGDANSVAKLQKVTTKLQRRSSSGDARATSLLRKIQDMQSQAQSVPAQQPSPTTEATCAAPASDYEKDYE